MIENSLYHIRTLSLEDDTILPQIVNFEENGLGSCALCLRSDLHTLDKCLSSGASFGLFINGKLEAYSLCYYNEYGVAYIEKCFVSAPNRGKGIQVELLRRNIFCLIEHGAVEIYALCSPLNFHSKTNFMKAGFNVLRQILCDGHERELLKFDYGTYLKDRSL